MLKDLSNIPGWRTKNKLIIFESDDWGSIRMPSLISFEKLEKFGIDLRSLDAERYNLNDTLETSNDLAFLFEILYNARDCTGISCVFTPIAIVANPDFNRIKESDFNQYYFEPFTETLKRSSGSENAFELWQEGIREKIFIPQMHGREHLNVIAWMKALNNKDQFTHLAFSEGLWGFVPNKKVFPYTDFQAAFLFDNSDELIYQQQIIKEGLNLFEELFGYRAKYFVPPNGPFNNSLNKSLSDNGIKFRSTSKVQNEPIGQGRTRKVFHWIGQKDRYGIRYITRNCFFEPNRYGKDWVDSCLNDIKIAFKWGKPAIISTHRVNYIGSLNKSNRDHGLNSLKELLSSIKKYWPDVEFITTPHIMERI